MIRNIDMRPDVNSSNSIIGSRAYTFLDSYIYMKNQRYNALYEKNKEILAIENNAISLKSANAIYTAFTEQVKILDSIVIRIRNFALRIKPDVLENINILIPSTSAINDFDEAIKKINNFEKMKYIHYDIDPIKYENMASFMNLYRAEIKGFTSINNTSVNRADPFIRDKATKYLIDISAHNKNSMNQLLEMEHIRMLTFNKLKTISDFFRHKSRFIANLNRDFKTFQFYLKQYSRLRELAALMKPTEHIDGMVSIPGNKNIITFNDYFVLYKHFNSMIKYMINILSYREQQFFNKIYALQSNIESYISIINDVIDMRNKLNNSEEELSTSEDVYTEAFDDGFLNSDTIDAHQMINGNDQAHMLLYDTIDDITDEDISNFEEYDGIVPKEGVNVCTLKNSLNL